MFGSEKDGIHGEPSQDQVESSCIDTRESESWATLGTRAAGAVSDARYFEVAEVNLTISDPPIYARYMESQHFTSLITTR